jgi:hypothetical protein
MVDGLNNRTLVGDSLLTRCFLATPGDRLPIRLAHDPNDLLVGAWNCCSKFYCKWPSLKAGRSTRENTGFLRNNTMRQRLLNIAGHRLGQLLAQFPST